MEIRNANYCAKVDETSLLELLECSEKGNDLISGNHCTKPQTANSCSTVVVIVTPEDNRNLANQNPPWVLKGGNLTGNLYSLWYVWSCRQID